MVARADDGGVIGVAGQRRKKLGHGAGKGCAKSRFLPSGQQYVIGCNAGLTGVQQLAVSDLEGGLIQITRGVKDAGRLAAQLQRSWGQVSSGGGGYFFADGG